MYFASRLQAGRMLASRLSEKYRYENCAVVALNDGGVMVGSQIATELHCVLSLLDSSEILLPQEPEPIAGITASGTVAYNHAYSDGDLHDLVGENFGYIEQEKLKRMHDMNHLVSGEGTISKDLLQDHYVILVADGYKNGFSLDLALEFLKPVRLEGIIIAAPFASVKAVDKMHIMADDLYCLNVLENYMTTEHYYDKQDVPSHEAITKTLSEIILNWK